MFNSLILMAVKVALCQLFNFCIRQPECPDGVCDDALQAIDSLDVGPVTAAPDTVRAFDPGSINWQHLKDVTDAVIALISALKAFFGMNKVGDQS